MKAEQLDRKFESGEDIAKYLDVSKAHRPLGTSRWRFTRTRHYRTPKFRRFYSLSSDYRHNTILARLVMPLIGFPKTTVVGPIWLRLMTPKGGSLKSDFERLLDLDFDRLLSAHGSLLDSGAKDSVAAAIRRAFPES